MEKAARKKSTDPVQEALRERKAIWNKSVSAFIDSLIQYKKLINGQPSKFNMERGTITQPIPSDPTTILSELSANFNDLAGRGNDIVQEQIAYSRGRRKKQPKSPKPVPQPSLSEQLTAAEESFELVSYAGLFGFWGADSKKRSVLYKRFKKLRKLYSALQVDIVNRNPESILRAKILFDKVLADVQIIESELKIQTQMSQPETGQEPSKAPVTPTKLESPKESNKELDAIKMVGNYLLDFVVNRSYFPLIDANLSSKLLSLNKEFRNPELSDDNEKNRIAKEIIKTYKELVKDLAAKMDSSGTTLQEIKKDKLIPKANQEKTASSQYQLETLAQKFLKKWFGKLRHKLWSDETTDNRLAVYEECSKIIDIIEELEDSVNDKLDLPFILLSVNKIKAHNDNIKLMIKSLFLVARRQRFEERHEKDL